MSQVDHVIFSAGDSLGAESGVRNLQKMGIWPVAVTGIVTRSELSKQEAVEATGLPCLSISDLIDGHLEELLQSHTGIPTSVYAV